MKKLIALLLAVMVLATLCACGETAPEAPETQAPASEDVIPTEDVVEITEEPTEEITQTVPVAVDSKLALAQSCVNKSVEELYALIGEPDYADYAPSCLNPGVGEDGNLEYDGFIVYTYREGDTETVQYVEETE